MGKKLVKGYAEFFSGNIGKTEEILYAVTETGKTYKSSRHVMTVHFIGNWTWELVNGFPHEAEFIGNYPYPQGVTD